MLAIEELDIWRTAKFLVDAHGDRAEEEASLRAQLALQQGTPLALGTWKRVLKAVQMLLRTQPFR